MSFELFRRVATNAMSILDLPDPHAMPTELGPADAAPADAVSP